MKLVIFLFGILSFAIAKPRTNSSQPFDFIFGWSTGHCGTTTLSSATSYVHENDVIFLFEGHGRCPGGTRSPRGQMSSGEIDSIVRDNYVPSMLACRGNRTTLIDLGHHNLAMGESLVKYFSSNDTPLTALFIRIRRDRFENALSLTYSIFKSSNDLCLRLASRVCPSDNPERVVLRLPPTLSWKNDLTMYQQAFWMVDEVEARWKRMLRLYPSMDRLEFYWAKGWDGSFEDVIRGVASAAQLKVLGLIPNIKNHVPDFSSNKTSILHTLYSEDCQYREKMHMPSC